MKPTIHQSLTAEKWKQLSFAEQMANVGSEVERALNWHKKRNERMRDAALARCLELIDLTRFCNRTSPTLKELSRTREAFLDFLIGENKFRTNEMIWRKYFRAFQYQARRGT